MCVFSVDICHFGTIFFQMMFSTFVLFLCVYYFFCICDHLIFFNNHIANHQMQNQ